MIGLLKTITTVKNAVSEKDRFFLSILLNFLIASIILCLAFWLSSYTFLTLPAGDLIFVLPLGLGWVISVLFFSFATHRLIRKWVE